jgi:hypothetical protein
MSAAAGDFAAVAITLYAAHHVGDYWVQTDEQARHKGDAGSDGALHCFLHVLSYLATQVAFLATLTLVTGLDTSVLGLLLGLLVSGGTHYLADRREHGLMLKLARALPHKAAFLKLGVVRQLGEVMVACDSCEGSGTSYDESTGGKCWDCRGQGWTPVQTYSFPQLATGAWALDQAWHIFFGVFVAALVIVELP